MILATTGCASSSDQHFHNGELRLSHVAIVVDDIEQTSRFFTDVVGWKRHPIEFSISGDEPTTGAMKLAFIDANGLWLELVEPVAPGPAKDLLDQKGSGTIIELAFATNDFDEMIQRMESDGIQMLAMDGSPLGEKGGRIDQTIRVNDAIERLSVRIAYWPTPLTSGTSVEVIDLSPDRDPDVFSVRDATRDEAPYAEEIPRMDRIAIMVEDVEASASFYTDVLGLNRLPRTFVMGGDGNEQSGGMKVAFIDGGAVWLVLVQPIGQGPLKDYLEANGNGYIAELIAEVDDLSGFFDKMKADGIHMVGTDGKPLDNEIKAHVLVPFGDRIAYFPSDVSRGVTLELSERGPPETSLIHARDRDWIDE
ncbi:VOC family protein [Hyphomonas sp.]|uniref:VOC family protein n=1 Tax=Hyphomonas sp. TaxID=87 RepID=UPI0037C032C8